MDPLSILIPLGSTLLGSVLAAVIALAMQRRVAMST
jgi:hypothetical protein